jgi:hypothetical protein
MRISAVGSGGIGRELGLEALNNYLEYQSIFASTNQLRG